MQPSYGRMPTMTQLLLIGSGHYGQLIEQSLTGNDFALTVLDGRAVTAASLKQEPVSCCIVATPNVTHVALVSACLEAGKDVVCEKPLAIRAHEVDQLYALADAAKRYLGVGFVLQHHAFYQAIRDLQGVHGPITAWKVMNNATEGTLEPAWYWDPHLSGGWFMVAEIHWYHLFAWVTKAASLVVQEASEEKHEGRTVATQSVIVTENRARLEVVHRLDSTYEDAKTDVAITFADGHTVTIDDWVPQSATGLPASLVSSYPYLVQEATMLRDTRSRTDRYASFIRANVLAMVGQKAQERSPILLAHQAAEDAQCLSNQTKH